MKLALAAMFLGIFAVFASAGEAPLPASAQSAIKAYEAAATKEQTTLVAALKKVQADEQKANRPMAVQVLKSAIEQLSKPTVGVVCSATFRRVAALDLPPAAKDLAAKSLANFLPEEAKLVDTLKKSQDAEFGAGKMESALSLKGVIAKYNGAAKPAAAAAAEPAAEAKPTGPDPEVAKLMVEGDPAKEKPEVYGFSHVRLGKITGEQWAKMRGKLLEVKADTPLRMTITLTADAHVLIVPNPDDTWSSGPGIAAVNYNGSDGDNLKDAPRMALMVSGNGSQPEAVEGVPLTGDGEVKLTIQANDDVLTDNTGSIHIKVIWVRECEPPAAGAAPAKP